MGDRAVIKFSEHGQDVAAIYSHWGGSTADLLLSDFFRAEQDNPHHDNRFGDPSYLAARFVVWAANTTGLGVGIVPREMSESSNWRVHCDSDQVPEVERLS